MADPRVEYDEDQVAPADVRPPPADEAPVRPTLPPGKGRRPTRHQYTNEHLAQMTGRSVQTVRRWRSEGRFDPKEPETVFRFIAPRLRGRKDPS